MERDHEGLVAAQFGGRARAYVDSADHATGADLARLAAIVAGRPSSRVLDLGCGGGHVTYAVAPHAAEVVAYDLAPQMLAVVAAEAAARSLGNVRTARGTAEALPFPDASFDVVLTRFSAHHWHDVEAGLAGMRRVVRPGGIVAIVDVVAPGDGERFDTFLQTIEMMRDPSHVRDYTVVRWSAMLRAAGFVPSAPVHGRLRSDFASWIERIGTPTEMARAIRMLQATMPDDLAARFAIEPDGSFTYDTVLIEACLAAAPP